VEVNPGLGVPTPFENTEIIAFPPPVPVSGGVAVSQDMRLWGAEANFRTHGLPCFAGWFGCAPACPAVAAADCTAPVCGTACGSACAGPCGCGGGWWPRIDLIAGFRYLGLDENLSINENVTPQLDIVRNGVTLPAGTSLRVSDRFGTSNRFYGGQIGA